MTSLELNASELPGAAEITRARVDPTVGPETVLEPVTTLPIMEAELETAVL